jgi:hypothetical protein
MIRTVLISGAHTRRSGATFRSAVVTLRDRWGRFVLSGFLAGYTGLTHEAYALDLRQYASWCQQNQLRLFQARRADIECFARDLEARGRATPGRLYRNW